VGLLDSWWDLWTPYVNLVGFLSKHARLLVWQLCSWFGSYGTPGHLNVFAKTNKCEGTLKESMKYWRSAGTCISEDYDIVPGISKISLEQGKVG